MSEKNTIARPYAKAAFELAFVGRSFQQWSDMLAFGAAMVENEDFMRLIKNPKFSDELCASWIIEIGKEVFESNTQGQEFIKLLTHSKRLVFLPEVALMYESYRKEAEKTVDAKVISARPLNESFKKQIQEALKTRLKVMTVELDCTIDESLIGGALIRAGDTVIDGTARGKLHRIGEALGI